MSIAYTWGTTPEERELTFPCDHFWNNVESGCIFFRGVTVNSSPEILYKWLCQLRIAPYSYDWIDNLGKRSPRTLTPGLDEITKGTGIYGDMCEIVDFEQDRSITMRTIPNGMACFQVMDMVITYIIIPQSEKSCRLLVKGICEFTNNPLGRFMRWFIPWGDLIMMRKQLLNLKALAESS